MDSILVTGNGPLNGKIPIAGAKNACLTLMPVTLLTDEPVTLTNAPVFKRYQNSGCIAKLIGCRSYFFKWWKSDCYVLHNLNSSHADYDIVRKMTSV